MSGGVFGRLGWTLHSLLSHWRRHPLQAACLLVGLWLATALWTGVQALNSQARDSYDRAAQLFGGSGQSVLVSPGGQLIPQEQFAELRRAGWPVSPLLQGSVSVATPAGERRLQLMGIEPLSLPGDGSLAAGRQSTDALVEFIRAPGRSWVAADTLADLGVTPSAPLTLADGRLLPPLQVVADMPPGTLVVDIGRAQHLLNQHGLLSELLVDKQFADGQPAIAGGLPLIWESRGEADLQRLTDSFHLNLTALGLLAFVVGLFIVHAAAGLAMEQRRGVMQTLRACGTSLRMLAAALLVELVLLALIGGSLGVLSGFVLAGLLMGDVAASLGGLYGAQIAGQLSLGAGWWLAGLGMSLFGTLLAGGSSVLTALRLPVLAWARPQAWRQAQGRVIVRLSGLAVLLLSAAVLLTYYGSSLLAGFALLACLLLGAAWLLPLFLQGALRIGARWARGPISQWFWADSQQQLSGLSMALMALLLALAASVGVGSMTEGFRQTFTGWLDQRLAADIYIRPENAEQAGEISAWLQARSEVRALLPSWQLDTRIEGWPTELSGVIEHPLYAETWPLIESVPDAWAALAAGQGAMVSEQMAHRLGLVLGDRLVVDTPAGEWPLKVLGRYADYGNPRGQLLVSATGLTQRWIDQPLTSLGVLSAPGRAAELASELQSQFALAGNRVIDQASLKRYSQEVFEQTFAATAALNTLTLGVAAIALLTSLLSLADSRLSQLAPLWAMGLRPSQLAGLSLLQMLVLAAFTCLMAIPLGLLLAWCLIDVVNVQAFGWRLPWHWFPGQWFTLVGFALVAVLVASVVPVSRIARARPGSLLRSFANES